MEEESVAASARVVVVSALGRPRLALLVLTWLTLAMAFEWPSTSRAQDSSLSRIRTAGQLLYGSDAEGGGPFAYIDPDNPNRVTGFEVELMERLCGALGPVPVFKQGQWDTLLQVLQTGHVDVVVNGYELTPDRTSVLLATRPYYRFQLQLMVRKGSRIESFEDLTRPKPGGGKWRLAVLGSSASEFYARDHGGETVRVLYSDGATDCMMAVQNGQVDATLQDYPAVQFYKEAYPKLEAVGPLVGEGSYVMYLRPEDVALRDALDQAIGQAIENGELEAVYRKYDIWTDAQEKLASLGPSKEAVPSVHRESKRGWRLVLHYAPTLLQAAGMTVFLSFASMPLAMLAGLLIALGRLYGPGPIRLLLGMYVELIRGTPLMLQLFVLFFLLPQLGISLPPLVAGIGGLAINYSAYEAEIYRAGLLAIPRGQMEAALSLGMSRGQALRRIIVPQAVRIVIPPVTNDFIALFKDTSVCSVIMVVELTKRYSILAQSTHRVVEFAVASSLLYLAMSLPLSWLARRFETQTGAESAQRARA